MFVGPIPFDYANVHKPDLEFDDYEWHRYREPERCPKLAVDAFLSVMRGKFDLLHRGYQLWIRKR